MSTAESYNNFTCCCHTCQAEQTTDVLCPDCGPSRAHYGFVSDEATRVPLFCHGCSRQIVKGGRELQNKPTQCQYCRSTDLGWRQRPGGEWRPEPAAASEEEGPWVRGDFDGDFAGSSGSEFRKLGNELGLDHRYSLTFKRAQLENVALVDGPPAERQHHDREPPLRFNNIFGVYVYRHDDDDSARVYRADLVDVRLHDWNKTIDESDLASLKGRLQGVAYARLRIPKEKPPEIEKRTQDVPTPVPVSEPDPDPYPDEPPTPAPAAPLLEPTAYCNTCNLFVLAAVALILYLACRWQTALLGVAVMALQCWWRSRRMTQKRNNWSDTNEKIFGGLLVLLALLAYLGALYQECLRLAFWWLVAMALLLLLTALLRRCWPWLSISLLWVLMLLSFYCKSFIGQCAIPDPPAGAPASISMPGFDMPSLGDLNPLPSLQIAMDNVVNGVSQRLAIDQDSHSVEDENSGRITLDQALSNPQEYFNCNPPSGRNRPQSQNGRSPYEITFSEAALFGLDKYELRPGAEAHLRKLARLIDANPGIRIILTGHADHSGSARHNLELSQRRAQTVADWLVSEGHMKPEQIDIRGAGDRYPIVNDPRLYRYNRRVDLAIDCSGVKR